LITSFKQKIILLKHETYVRFGGLGFALELELGWDSGVGVKRWLGWGFGRRFLVFFISGI